jgi:hypothetical protein
LRTPDPEVGIEEFDRRVRIHLRDKYEATAMTALQPAGIREAIVRLVAMRCRVVIGDPRYVDEGREYPDGTRVSAEARVYLTSDVPDLGEVTLYVIALAAADGARGLPSFCPQRRRPRLPEPLPSPRRSPVPDASATPSGAIQMIQTIQNERAQQPNVSVSPNRTIQTIHRVGHFS